ncbi:outer membrane protein assembly factor BamB [Marinomonas piezotolerans]|uniref:Outer membrane protein assembly factor BamB n=1 Tax=Marinomonas piezotolerans TaxID=2213058 RepID=A0A370U6K1_9GAMM|nr:outer membrane protein assembly factor BamB [Marinomonas piezotolerans]RDL43406.1 outer membrane protein assembly factor BamB [Marinomonas piezotolerans]
MWKPLIAAAIMSAVLLQGCSTRSPLPAPERMQNEVYFDTSWRRGVDGGAGEQTETYNIVAEDESLYFVTNRGAAYELDQEKGTRKTYFKTGIEPSSGIAREGDNVFFGTYDAEIVALSMTDKSVLWKKALTSEVLSEPAVGKGFVAVQTGDGWLTVVDANNGGTLWRDKEDIPALTVRGTTAPVILDDKVIAGFASGKVKAFNLSNGELLWEYAVGKPEGRYEIERLTDVSGRLTVKNGFVYAVAYNGTLTAISVQTGRPVWQRNISSAVGVAIRGDKLIAVDQDSNVYALNSLNGSTLWSNDRLAGRDLATPVFFRDYIAVLDRGGWVHLLDQTTGKIGAWTLADTQNPAGSRMVSNDKQLFILTPTAKVTALSY